MGISDFLRIEGSDESDVGFSPDPEISGFVENLPSDLLRDIMAPPPNAVRTAFGARVFGAECSPELQGVLSCTSAAVY
jgi:hypothetical protein